MTSKNMYLIKFYIDHETGVLHFSLFKNILYNKLIIIVNNHKLILNCNNYESNKCVKKVIIRKWVLGKYNNIYIIINIK